MQIPLVPMPDVLILMRKVFVETPKPRTRRRVWKQAMAAAANGKNGLLSPK